jgi:hypothetical protein
MNAGKAWCFSGNRPSGATIGSWPNGGADILLFLLVPVLSDSMIIVVIVGISIPIFIIMMTMVRRRAAHREQ